MQGPLPKRAKTTSQELRASSISTFNVSSLVIDGVLPAGGEIYSVTLRDQGPDYRFITKINDHKFYIIPQH